MTASHEQFDIWTWRFLPATPGVGTCSLNENWCCWLGYASYLPTCRI